MRLIGATTIAAAMTNRLTVPAARFTLISSHCLPHLLQLLPMLDPLLPNIEAGAPINAVYFTPPPQYQGRKSHFRASRLAFAHRLVEVLAASLPGRRIKVVTD